MHIQMILKVIQTVMTKIIQDLGLENQLKEGMQSVEWSTRSHHSKKTIDGNRGEQNKEASSVGQNSDMERDSFLDKEISSGKKIIFNAFNTLE